MTKVDRAAEFARKAHEGGFRRDKKTPYIVHPADVVARLKSWGITDEDILSAAWLHDTVEDTELTEKVYHLDYILSEFFSK